MILCLTVRTEEYVGSCPGATPRLPSASALASSGTAIISQTFKDGEPNYSRSLEELTKTLAKIDPPAETITSDDLDEERQAALRSPSSTKCHDSISSHSLIHGKTAGRQ